LSRAFTREKNPESKSKNSRVGAGRGILLKKNSFLCQHRNSFSKRNPRFEEGMWGDKDEWGWLKKFLKSKNPGEVISINRL